MTKSSFKPIWEEDRFADLLTDEPPIITIMLGTNDCHPLNSDEVRANYENDYRGNYELKLKSGEGFISSEAVEGFSIPIKAIFNEKINIEILRKMLTA